MQTNKVPIVKTNARQTDQWTIVWVPEIQAQKLTNTFVPADGSEYKTGQANYKFRRATDEDLRKAGLSTAETTANEDGEITKRGPGRPKGGAQ